MVLSFVVDIQGRRRSSLPPSLDLPLQDDVKNAVDLFRRQFDVYTDIHLQVRAVDDLFLTFTSRNSNIVRPHLFRSVLGDFLARGEYDFATTVLKSLRQRVLNTFDSTNRDLDEKRQLSQEQSMITSEFNDLLLETQAASLRLTGCRLAIPLLPT